MNDELTNVKRKLASNTLFLFLDYFMLSLFSLLFWSSAGKFLSPSQYGIASTSINLLSLLSGFAGLGLSISLSKLIPEYLAKNQKKKINGLIKFSLIVTLISSLIISVVFILVSPLLSKTLQMPYYILLLLPVIIILASLSQIIFGILSGYQNMKGLFSTDFISNAAKLILSILLILIGFTYLGPIAGFGLGVLLVLLFRTRLLPKLNLSTEGIDKKRIFFEYALPSFIVSISTILLTYGQITILGLMKSPEVTGIFSVAFILSNVLVMIFRILSRALFPITSQLSVQEDSVGIQGYFINLVLRYGLFLSIPILIMFTLFSDRLILIFSSKEYLTASSLVTILSISSILYGISVVLNSSIYAIGKPKIQRNISVISSVIFLLLAFPLTYIFEANGMAYSYLTYSIILVVFGVYNARKYLKMNLPIRSFSKIAISGIISFTLLFLFSLIIEGVIEKIFFAILSGLVYLAILVFLKFVTSEDIKVLKFISNKSPLLKKQFNYIINKIPKS